MRPNLSLLCILLLINSALLDLSEEDVQKITASCEEGSFTPSKKSDCLNAIDDEAKNAGYYCCFVEYKLKSKPENAAKEGNACTLLNKNEYDNIKDTIKKYKNEVKEEENNEFKKLKIKCQSSYLKIGVIGLIFALIL